MSFSFGSSQEKQRGTQVVQVPAPSAQETELQDLNLQIAQEQVRQMQASAQKQAEFEASPLAAQQRLLEEKATANLLARVTGEAPVLSREEQARLDLIYGTAESQGEESLKTYAQDLAASRGMTTADSPIFNEALRQRRLFGESLAAQKAGASLDLGQANAAFNQSVQQFQNQLRQQALMNRLAMAGTSPASFGYEQSMFGRRLEAAPRSFSGLAGTSGYQAGLSGKDVAGWGSGMFGGAGFFGTPG